MAVIVPTAIVALAAAPQRVANPSPDHAGNHSIALNMTAPDWHLTVECPPGPLYEDLLLALRFTLRYEGDKAAKVTPTPGTYCTVTTGEVVTKGTRESLPADWSPPQPIAPGEERVWWQEVSGIPRVAPGHTPVGDLTVHVSLGVPYELEGVEHRLRAKKDLTVRVLPVPPAERPNWETYQRLREARQAKRQPNRGLMESLLNSQPRSAYVAQGVWLYLCSRYVKRWSLTEGDWPERKAVGMRYLRDPGSRDDPEWLVQEVAAMTAEAACELGDEQVARAAAARCDKSNRAGVLWKLEAAKDPRWQRALAVGRERRLLAAQRQYEYEQLEARLKAQWPFTPEEQKLIPTPEQFSAELRRLADELKLYDSLHDAQKTFYLPEDRATMQWKLRLDALKKVEALRAQRGVPAAVAASPWPPEPTTPELKLWAEYLEKRLQLDATDEESRRLADLETEVSADGVRTAEEWQRLLAEIGKMVNLRPQPHLASTPAEILEMQGLNQEYSRRMKQLSQKDAEQMMRLKRPGDPADLEHLKWVMREFDRLHPESKGGVNR
jgi:hypothetical protein